MQYHSVPLSSALEERGISAPDEPAFARDAPIGEKLSVCLWVSISSRNGHMVWLIHVPQVKGVCLRRKCTDGFTSKQHRVRSGKGKEGQPITRANLARLVALDVQRFMVRRILAHICTHLIPSFAEPSPGSSQRQRRYVLPTAPEGSAPEVEGDAPACVVFPPYGWLRPAVACGSAVSQTNHSTCIWMVIVPLQFDHGVRR